ncbi:DUF6498-containing protein [Halobaculum limi]|uniref:DUF6498-containing protein n=1 Tax=Halobaculum limi TaxID=3031916 RepID=UPI0024072F22|nr:DUF6498-containing protein [Halobaculum sp. YSMS11]
MPSTALLSGLVVPVGVLYLGWPIAVVLGVFVLEVWAVVFWAIVKIPFAAKRPRNMIDGDDRLLGPLQTKRGSLTLPGPLPPVYLRNIPTLLVTAGFLAPLEVGVTVLVFAFTDPTITTPVVEQLLLGGAGVFLAEGIETVREYFLRSGFREHSARSVVLVPFKRLFGVGALLFVAGPLQGSAVSGEAVLGLVVIGKLCYDLRRFQVARNPDARGLFYRLYGSAETEPNPVPVEVPPGEPLVRERPPRGAALFDAIYRGVTYTLTSGVLVVYLAAVFFLVFGATAVGSIALGIAAVFACVRAGSRYLRYGTVEYRGYDGTLVVYDRLLGEPQARLERTAVTDVEVTGDTIDSVFDTQTVRLSGADDGDTPPVRLTIPDPEELDGDDANANSSVSLVHVRAHRALVDALGVSWHLDESTGSA